jgi:hypothetical protein
MTQQRHLTAVKPADTDELAERVETLVALQAQAADLADQITALKADLLDALPNGTTKSGQHSISITAPRRFNPDKFTEQYPPSTNPALYTDTLVRKQADAFMELARIDPDPFYTTGKRQVTVR